MAEQRSTETGRVTPERNTAYPETAHAQPTAAAASPVTAQGATVLTMLAGLWVAISPWVLTVPDAAVHNLVVGLAVAAFGLLALSGSRGFASLQSASLLTGVWVIVSPWLLDMTILAPQALYWSNIIAGGVIVALSVLGGGISSVSAMRRR